MISLYKVEDTGRYRVNPDEELISVELRGLSTDTKPTEINGKTIDNGSQLIEIDTGKVYLYDLENEQWKEV